MIPQRCEMELECPSNLLNVEDTGGTRNSNKINIDPDNTMKGLGKLVLTVIELLRELLERQAIRRMESGSLTKEEINKLGITFMRLKGKMEDLKGYFGLTDEDLNIDLGPLGKLL